VIGPAFLPHPGGESAVRMADAGPPVGARFPAQAMALPAKSQGPCTLIAHPQRLKPPVACGSVAIEAFRPALRLKTHIALQSFEAAFGEQRIDLRVAILVMGMMYCGVTR
jgi:hypothetical protein